MPLSFCGKGYSRKLPLAVIDGKGVDCIFVAGVSVGPLFAGVGLLSLHATRNSARSTQQHIYVRYFNALVPFSTLILRLIVVPFFLTRTMDRLFSDYSPQRHI